MSRARNRYGRGEKCIESLIGEPEGKRRVEDLSAEGE